MRKKVGFGVGIWVGLSITLTIMYYYSPSVWNIPVALAGLLILILSVIGLVRATEI